MITHNQLRRTVLFVLIGTAAFVAAQDFGVPTRSTTGVGGRAMALGNNYVAVADDASAMFWNPAGLAFTPVREFYLTLNGFSHRTAATFQTGPVADKTESDRQRIRPNAIALLRSVPTKQGGLSFAFGFQNPYVMDENLKYNGSDENDFQVARNYHSFGQMNLWTAALGMQVAPYLGIGAAISLLGGHSTMSLSERYPELNYEIRDRILQGYLGCDVRLGMVYSLVDRLKIGMRFVLPQVIVFNEEYTIREFPEDTLVIKETNNGRLKSAPEGALGVSYRFPFMMITAETRARAPVLEAADESWYSFWRIGAGAGMEVPLFVKSFFLRAGYAWQEYDQYSLLIDYDIPPGGFNPEFDATITKDEHLLSTGLSYITPEGISFDITYGYKFWELAKGALSEEHAVHSIAFTFAIRY